MIVAGAGSGKTRVLTSRVAYILALGCSPDRVLALTFTKKAAGEMKERIGLMVGAQKARRVVMGTFHSVFIRFLRDYAGSIGYPGTFTIYDQSDSVSAIKACLKELNLDDKIYKPKDVQSRISKAKNNLVTVKAYRANQNLLIADSHSKRPRLVDVYELYQDKMKKSGVMDFDDILVNMNILLRDNPAALDAIAARFSYILVDEYQDTNCAQYLILKKLAQGHHNICVVGDDSQSIYAFRGAKIENILNFKKDYPECRTFRLECNYRSTSTIVDAANSLIAHNEGRIPKTCYARGEQGEPIHVIRAFSESDEAARIVDCIKKRIREDSARYEDFAILYRTNSQSRALEDQLRRWNIPYMIYSGNSFFERAEVKDLMAYFKLAVNPLDDESFKRAVNKPGRGIGDTTVAALATAAQVRQTTFFRAVYLDDIESFGIRSAAVQKLRTFCGMIDRFHSMVPVTDAFELARRIADDSGIYAFYKSDNSIEGQARTANVEELVNSVLSFVEDRRDEADDGTADVSGLVFTLDDYLENVSLLSNADTDDKDDTNKVSLMTVHSSKGLEYPHVFVAGMEENLFPSGTMTSVPADIEEERRLFYVAITRAGRTVGLSYATTRIRNGNHESNAPSRFLSEIDSRYLDAPVDFDDNDDTASAPAFRFPSKRGYQYGRSGSVTFERRGARPAAATRPVATATTASPAFSVPKPPVIDKDFVPEPMGSFRTGQRIEHNRFGAGLILEITGREPELKARIRFDDYGEKILLLKYAKMRALK